MYYWHEILLAVYKLVKANPWRTMRRCFMPLIGSKSPSGFLLNYGFINAEENRVITEDEPDLLSSPIAPNELLII